MGLLHHLTPTPAFPSYPGPYKVGTIDVEIPVSELQDGSSAAPDASINTVACRVFYPCQPNPSPARPVHWIQRPQHKTVQAYSTFLGASSGTAKWISHTVSQHLYYTTIPAHRNAKPHSSPHSAGRWPVMFFSHGLSGSRNCYSYFCGSMASFGQVVIAPDHRDGSQVIAHLRATSDAPASIKKYNRISHDPSDEVYQARDDQLKVRIWELGLLHEALHKINKGENITNLDANRNRSKLEDNSHLLGMFTGILDIDRPGSIAWAGHSFGACTTVQFVKSVYYSSKIETPITTARQTSLKDQITPTTPVILLDLWTLPLRSPFTSELWEKPLPCFSSQGYGGMGTLAILSEAFAKWESNFRDHKRVMRTPSSHSDEKPKAPSHMFYPIKSAHLGQSDFGILFPHLTKYLAKAEEPIRTMRLNIRACVAMLRGVNVPLADVKWEDLEDPTAEKGSPDRKILDKAAGSVPGWVCVRPEDPSEQPPKKTETIPADATRGRRASRSVVNAGKV